MQHSSSFPLSVPFHITNMQMNSSKKHANFHNIIHIFPIVGSLIVIGHCIFTTIQRRYSLFTLSLFMYADLILAQYCNYAFERLPPREKSARKSLLKFALFLLSAGNLFAVVSQSAPFYGPLTAALFYAIAIGGSVFLFYAYMIYDGEGGESCFDGEEKRPAFCTVELSFIYERV